MDSRIVDTLRLTFTGVLLAGCESRKEAEACGVDAGESQPGPPTLIAARFETDLIVRLTFSEPLAPIGDVNPASFRISWANAYGTYSGTGYTSYYDPVLMFCLSSDYCPDEYADIVQLDCASDDPAALLLRIDFFPDYICNIFDQIYDDGMTPLLMHFDADMADITDRDGESLESIAAHFVTAPDGYALVEGEFPNYPMRIPIECPP